MQIFIGLSNAGRDDCIIWETEQRHVGSYYYYVVDDEGK